MDTSDRPDRQSWGPPVVVETHGALIFLCGDKAHKVRKPIDLGFLDNRTVQARAEQSHREVELGRRLAPDVYLGVLQVRRPRSSGGLHYDDDEVVDHVVEMRRLPERESLAWLVREREAGASRVGDTDIVGGLGEVARQVARLHADSHRTPEIDAAGDPGVVAGLWTESLQHLRGLSVGEDAPGIVDDIADLADAYLRGRGPLLRSRIEAGRVVDGHGDLLAADVYLTGDGPRIIDCLEFDDRLRFGDAVLDIGFLAMDLDRSGATDLAVGLLEAYREASGDDAPASLVHHYMAYRALVRAKVAAIRAAQTDSGGADARLAVELAARAVDGLLRARVRLVLVGGASGSGKSSVAAPLAAALRAELVRSDLVRSDVARREGAEGRYSPEAIAAVYAEMLDRAAGHLALGRSVVLDATWLEPRRRAEAETVAADAHAELVEISCTAPRDELARRVTERARAGTDPSEATVEVLDAQLADRAPWPDAIELDTTALDGRDGDAVRRWAERELGPLPWA
ncbi:AAA family ATPase [uncultured Dietzia sp.]|uniref:bifunctional aminoglycoside phosphotransferase/ATP-binding protein n=1 Tax=uncultured Dietzia sp. TaxID=395519 RepID=UPI0025E73203|nr:AAA family ATPase [uncultured Dietzia sp.]